MKETIEKYKKFIFVFTLINLFALLVNVAEITINSNVGNNEIYYFTNHNIDGRGTFWPFVTYYHTFNQGYSSELNVFKGIFYQYGGSEFLLYMGILIAFLVYKAYISKPVKASSINIG